MTKEQEDKIIKQAQDILERRLGVSPELKVNFQNVLYYGSYLLGAQMAMKWLREERGMFINILNISCRDINDHFWFYATIYTKGEKSWEEVEWFSPFFKTYEVAVETALKYCLENLI